MRPAGEVRQALLKAAAELVTEERGPTLRELAQHAKVGLRSARHTVNHMKRSGVLQIVRPRVVDYRNRPVAEYSPAVQVEDAGQTCQPLADLIRSWAATPAA